MTALRFPKSQRITRKGDIDLLFTKAKTLRKGSVMLKYIIPENRDQKQPVQVLIVVSKKRLNKAVDRNKVKRQLREIYRRNQKQLQNFLKLDKTLLLAIVYVGQGKVNFHQMERDYLKLVEKMKTEMAIHID